MAYTPEPPPDKVTFAENGDSLTGLSLLKNNGYSGYNGYKSPGIDLVIDDTAVAVLIDSTLLGVEILFALRDGWRPYADDRRAVFFASELPFLRRMSQQELRRRYEEKRALVGGWIRDRKSESAKH